MALSVADDVFASTLSSIRESFVTANPHLAESERQLLWNQFLTPFLSAPSSAYGDVALGKRPREDIPPTLAGSPSTKRRRTVGVHPVVAGSLLRFSSLVYV
jgi:hypothetical protein